MIGALLADFISPETIRQWEPMLGRKRWLAILKALAIFSFISVPIDLLTAWGVYNVYILIDNEQPLSYPWGIFSIVVLVHFLIKEATVLAKSIKDYNQIRSFFWSINIHPIENILYLIFLYGKYDPLARNFNIQETSVYKNPNILSHSWNQEVNQLDSFTGRLFPPSQSLVRFIKERAFFPDCGTLDVSFLIFCALLPKKRDLSIDGIKSLLLAFPRFYDDDIYQKIPLDIIFQQGKIDDLFKNYSEEQLKKIFLRRYNAHYFFEIIRVISYKQTVIPLPLLDTLKECYDYLMDDSPKMLFHPRLIEVNQISVEIFSFKVLLTEREYKLWGTKLRNCIKDQCWNGRSDIIGIFKDGEFYGACAFQGGTLEQIKLADNKEFPLDEKKTILDVLEKHLR